MIKQKLTSTHVFALQDLTHIFEDICAAKKTGIGAVLSQNGPIEFFNERLKHVRVNYSAYDVELYAAVHALRHLETLFDLHGVYYQL